MFLWLSSRTAAYPGLFVGLDLLVSLVSLITAMLTLLLWRKVSIIVSILFFILNCILHDSCHRIMTYVHFVFYTKSKYLYNCTNLYEKNS